MATASAPAPVRPDLTMCDVEPITRLDMIQDFGFLIALANDWTVVRVSANLADHIGVEAKAALGKNFADLIIPFAERALRDRMASVHLDGSERVMCLRLVANRPPSDINMHLAGDLLIIEGEAASPANEEHGMPSMRGIANRLSSAPSLNILHRLATQRVRAVTGFDRVMIYRFDEQGNGEVIAEAARSGIETFIGLHYPAADIPQQARALYLANPFRIISDVSSSPIALLPAVSALTEPLDMTDCITRSVSPVHIEYLQNMGVKATLSISIIVRGELWGLIVCHHYVPRLPSLALRAAAELFGTIYSMSLTARLQRDIADEDERTREVSDRMMGAIAGNGDLLSDPQWLQDISREMFEFDGVAICRTGEIFTSGQVPDEDAVRSLTQYLNITSPSRVFTTDCLTSIDPGFSAIAETAAGMLAIPISRTPRDHIMLFRREQMRSINWGGDPAKVPIDSSHRLSPRKSFAAFAEVVRGKSLPFTRGERRTGEAIRMAMVEVILRLSEAHHTALARSEADRWRAVEALREGEKLQAIGQLTGGIAHDFNNILQQVFSGTALLRVAGNTEERRSELLDKLDLAAEAARELTARLLAFARRQFLKPEAVDVNALIKDQAEFLRHGLGTKVDLHLDLDSGQCWAMVDASQLKVAILTMATNARDAMLPHGGRFTLQTRRMMVDPSTGESPGECIALKVCDSGSGMSDETLARIFEPFFTTKRPGMGTGLGLAQVWGFAKQSSGGISAASEPGKGTTFSLLLPTPDEAALAAALKNAPMAPAVAAVEPARSKVILIVEDIKDVADATMSLLTQEGYVTQYAATADEALAILDSGKLIDAVFSDVVMPGSINGVQLAAAIRSRHPNVAIALASGYAQFLSDGADVGSTEVLSKPYRVADLTAALKRAFAAVAVT